MKLIDTSDNFKTFKISIDGKIYSLGDTTNYQKDINDLLLTLDDLLYNSLIFIFGFDNGEYLPYLLDCICTSNKIIIIEPNKEIYDYYHEQLNNNFIKMFYFEPNKINKLFLSCISYKNFTNLYVHAFGNYKTIYKDEYTEFIKTLDEHYVNAASSLHFNLRFKNNLLENLIANIQVFNNSTPLNSFVDSNIDVPAIIVSAGPSLDKNIQDLLKYKDNLDNYFIIAGTRTLKVLLENNITPDLVVSIDPINANYEMLKDYLDADCYLAYYEYSNRYLVKEFKGEKIYISGFLSKFIDDLEGLTGTYSGGSVAHTCVDIAHIMGCNPIILLGQDLAHTYDKHHAESANFDLGLTNDNKQLLTTKDVYGYDIKTTPTLNKFKTRLEEYIEMVNENDYTEFINCAYGAAIKGCEHKELSDVLSNDVFYYTKNKLYSNKCISVDYMDFKNSIVEHVDEYLDKCQTCINLCKELSSLEEDLDLTKMDKEDINFQNFIFVLDVVTSFENNILSKLLGGHYVLFLYHIKQSSFKMFAKDFSKYTSNLHYQSKAFLNYFEKLSQVLNEIKIVLDKTLAEFY